MQLRESGQSGVRRAEACVLHALTPLTEGRRRILAAVGMLGCLLSFDVRPLLAQPVELSAEQVDQAIERGVTWLQSQRKSDGHWERGEDKADRYWGGDTALALLALLNAGEDPQRSEMNRALTWLSEADLKTTYVYSLRAQVLSLVSGAKFRQRLEDDTRWLVRAAFPRGGEHPGGFAYFPHDDPQTGNWYDNSNSQFGVLGIWMASEAGVRIADAEGFWNLVEQHWRGEQNGDGGWGYRERQQSTGSMTAAGLSTLYIVLDRLYGRGGYAKGPDLLRALRSGLVWLGREFTPDNPQGQSQWKYYYLYGVERAGRASGRKYLVENDWFRIGAADLVRTQQQDGSWAGGDQALHDTCFALLFLCHGRAPLLFNKLVYGDEWDTQLRDVAGLARFVQRSLERLLNWQIVDLNGPMQDLLEAPVLYMSGESGWSFSDADALKIREYCLRGGLLFGVASGQSEAFSDSFRGLAARLFPEYPMRPVATDHPLFNGELQFPIDPPPLLLEVNNGVRTLMLLSLADLAESWNGYRVNERAPHFQLGSNLYLYATDRVTVGSRLQSAQIAIKPVSIQRTIRVARIRYNGNWDVEPFGWARLGDYLNNEAAARLLVSSGVTLDAPDLRQFAVAYISGCEELSLSEAELAGLRSFLTGGGTLLADGAGGSPAFVSSLSKHVSDVLKSRPQNITPASALLTGAGISGATSLRGMKYRRAALGGGEWPQLKGVELGRRWAVVYSPLDISTGLLGTPVYGCRGYESESALRIARNLLLYASLNSAEKSELNRAEKFEAPAGGVLGATSVPTLGEPP